MEENHMGWKLVKGVRLDVINLFKLFSDMNSIRYEDFCKAWKQMKFSLIYSNRYTFIELLEFTEELFQIVKEYLLSVHSFHTRVAALYTLYGLYFKQPIREAAKIRFTKSEWEEVHSFINKCKLDRHYDVLMIHLKLYLRGAYTFTSTLRASGIERGFRKYYEIKKNNVINNCDLELLFRPILSEKLVNSLVQLESLYCQKKVELLGKRNLEFINGKFAVKIQEELEKYTAEKQKLLSVAETPPQINNDKGGSEEETAGVVRRNIRAMSVTHNTANEEVIEDDVEEKKGKKRCGKYLEMIAKKKAEFYIKKLQGESATTKEATFDLPELDFS